jgi:preprotein translocase SecE subunit
MADQPDMRAKRRVKNPETFRERALKAADVIERPKRAAKAGRVIAKPFRMVFGPVGRFLSRLAAVQPFKTIVKLLRWVGLIILPVYIRRSWQELRLVTWPTWQQSRQLTFAVLAFAIVFGGAVAGVDYGLDKLFKSILLK